MAICTCSKIVKFCTKMIHAKFRMEVMSGKRRRMENRKGIQQALIVSEMSNFLKKKTKKNSKANIV